VKGRNFKAKRFLVRVLKKGSLGGLWPWKGPDYLKERLLLTNLRREIRREKAEGGELGYAKNELMAAKKPGEKSPVLNKGKTRQGVLDIWNSAS